jgi:hypothetical protein
VSTAESRIIADIKFFRRFLFMEPIYVNLSGPTDLEVDVRRIFKAVYSKGASLDDLKKESILGWGKKALKGLVEQDLMKVSNSEIIETEKGRALARELEDKPDAEAERLFFGHYRLPWK